MAVYKATKTFPLSEMYGQIRRSCSSIAANILEYHLLLSCDLGFLKTHDYQQLVNKLSEVKKMLATFIKKLGADG